jgi:hypothetical protein
MDALTEIGGTPLEHEPYSPDTAPCDFCAFLTMKREFKITCSTFLLKLAVNCMQHVLEK